MGRLSPDGVVDPSSRDRRCPHGERVCADGGGPHADLRRDGHHQHRTRRSGRPRCVPQLRARAALGHRLVHRATDHHSPHVRPGRDDPNGLPASLGRARANCHVDSRHLRSGDHHRRGPRAGLRGRLCAAARVVRRPVGAPVRVLPPLHLRLRIRARGGDARGALFHAVPDQVRAKRARVPAGSSGSSTRRNRRRQGGGGHFRHWGRSDRCRGDGLRGDERLQPELRLRPHLAPFLAIVILGGLGSIGGAMGAAVFALVVEDVVSIWSPTWAPLVFFALLVLVLSVRPIGFFGHQAARAQ